MSRPPFNPCGLLLVSLLLCGCGTSAATESVQRTVNTPLAQAVEVAALAKAQNPHVGNASADLAVLDALHLEVVGARTVELATEKAPHGLTIAFNASREGLTAEQAHEALRKRAVLAMACIDNLDVVNWELSARTPGKGTLTRAEAEKLAGTSLAGQCTEDSLHALVKKLDA